MRKPLNGIFRAWTYLPQADSSAAPVIWGDCVVHLSHPEFSGSILHTSGVIEITEHRGIEIAETRNSYYALLGPKLPTPAGANIDPVSFIASHRSRHRRLDMLASAAMDADPHCGQCHGSGILRQDERHYSICRHCCRHSQGWWQLEGAYGKDNGRWACKAGCGAIVDMPPPELRFLPRTENEGKSSA